MAEAVKALLKSNHPVKLPPVIYKHSLNQTYTHTLLVLGRARPGPRCELELGPGI